MSQLHEVTMEPSRLSPPASLVALVAPDVGMERVVATGKARWPLLIAVLCSLLFAGAEALRLDARESTLREMETKGELKTASDRQVDENVTNAEKAELVKGLAAGAVRRPVDLLGFVIAVYALSWFLRGRNKGWQQMKAVAATALLPGAAADLLGAVAAFRASVLPLGHEPLVPRTLASLASGVGLQLGESATRLLGAVDLFGLWSALLVGFGLGYAALLPRSRALTATLVAWTLWRLLTNVALGG